jgi:hypothetical protein
MIFVLDADEATIRSRKDELSDDELRRQRQEYHRLLTHRGFYELRANGSIQDVVESANRLILDFLSRRFILRYPELVRQRSALGW